MSIKMIILIMVVGVLVLVFGIKWMKKLPQSVLNFLALLAVMSLLIVGVMYLKRKLTEEHHWN